MLGVFHRQVLEDRYGIIGDASQRCHIQQLQLLLEMAVPNDKDSETF